MGQAKMLEPFAIKHSHPKLIAQNRNFVLSNASYNVNI
jgi:hypothetical protein